jgi:Aldo/keto reductase family
VQVINLGTSGLKVSRVALGGMSFGTPAQYGPWTLDDQVAEPIFRQAVELGITFWETSNNYGMGSSEEIIGRALRKYAPVEAAGRRERRSRHSCAPCRRVTAAIATRYPARAQAGHGHGAATVGLLARDAAWR